MVQFAVQNLEHFSDLEQFDTTDLCLKNAEGAA